MIRPCVLGPDTNTFRNEPSRIEQRTLIRADHDKDTLKPRDIRVQSLESSIVRMLCTGNNEDRSYRRWQRLHLLDMLDIKRFRNE